MESRKSRGSNRLCSNDLGFPMLWESKDASTASLSCEKHKCHIRLDEELCVRGTKLPLCLMLTRL